MALNQRLSAPPDIDAAKVEARQSRLPVEIAALIHEAGAALDRDQLDIARNALARIFAAMPGQADALRLAALLYARLGHPEAARANFTLALQQVPDDALAYHQFAQACEESGDVEAALKLRQQAIERIPGSPLAWYDFGEHQFRQGRVEDAIAPLQNAVELSPQYAPARLKLGSALVYCGRIEEGAAEYREVLRSEPDFGAAWYSLANIKTLRFSDAEVAQMQDLLRAGALGVNDRVAIQFALAKACEDNGACREAYDLLVDANASMRRQVDWSAPQFSAQMRHAEAVFAAPHSTVQNPNFGEQAIFIVGLPRSGTTLIEQILASHSAVEGANELGDLGSVVTAESVRLRQPYPDWVATATAQDWQRLGQEYLDRTARWRHRRPRFTDKMPNNWMFLGAIRAMLPGARVVICRRDPLENCWSCFKQFFFSGWDFSFDMDDIASYWKDFDRSASLWAARDPGRVREQRYEALLADPEGEIRSLLEFCGLPFESSCLNFHESSRSVRTASAGQVRQPLQQNTARASRYGVLLNPLRAALGMPPEPAA